jgi:hypothetical protein
LLLIAVKEAIVVFATMPAVWSYEPTALRFARLLHGSLGFADRRPTFVYKETPF